MSKFVFKNSQRVILPLSAGAGPNVQAVITARKEFAWREPEYDLQWLLTEHFCENNYLCHGTASLSESILIHAQPTAAPSDKVPFAIESMPGMPLQHLAVVDIDRAGYAMCKPKTRKHKTRKFKSRNRRS